MKAHDELQLGVDTRFSLQANLELRLGVHHQNNYNKALLSLIYFL